MLQNHVSLFLPQSKVYYVSFNLVVSVDHLQKWTSVVWGPSASSQLLEQSRALRQETQTARRFSKSLEKDVLQSNAQCVCTFVFCCLFKCLAFMNDVSFWCLAFRENFCESRTTTANLCCARRSWVHSLGLDLERCHLSSACVNWCPCQRRRSSARSPQVNRKFCERSCWYTFQFHARYAKCP